MSYDPQEALERFFYIAISAKKFNLKSICEDLVGRRCAVAHSNDNNINISKPQKKPIFK